VVFALAIVAMPANGNYIVAPKLVVYTFPPKTPICAGGTVMANKVLRQRFFATLACAIAFLERRHSQVFPMPCGQIFVIAVDDFFCGAAFNSH